MSPFPSTTEDYVTLLAYIGFLGGGIWAACRFLINPVIETYLRFIKRHCLAGVIVGLVIGAMPYWTGHPEIFTIPCLILGFCSVGYALVHSLQKKIEKAKGR